MLAPKRPEVNPWNLPRAGDESRKQGIHPGFETQGQTLPEVRYWRISGPTKRADIRKQECIPVGCVLPAAVAVGEGLPQCMLGYPPVCGPGDPPMCGPGDPPWVWSWQDPPTQVWSWQDPPRCGPGDPPGDLLQGMLGYHLQCMLEYHPPPRGQTDTCKT